MLLQKNTSRILGFDPASYRNLGWSSVEKTNIQSGTIIFQDVEEPWHVLWPLFEEVNDLISAIQPQFAIIEKTSSFSGGFVTGQVSNCMGVILCCCRKNQLPVHFVYPTHVKKVVANNGRATKSQLRKELKKMWYNFLKKELKFDSDHACDALANITAWILDQK